MKTKIGMPGFLYLHDFGSLVWEVFDGPPYLVGSAISGEATGPPRDIDIRVILSDEDYEAWGLGDPRSPSSNGKWRGLVMAFSALGVKMTGLPIDFQIQQQTRANEEYSGNRSALGIVPLRMAKLELDGGKKSQ